MKSNQTGYDLEKILNNYFVIFLLLIINVIFYLRFGDKFGDLLIDSSREVTVPLRIIDGQIIYKDFHYEYGPFVPYFFSCLIRVFNDGLEMFRVTGLIIATVVSILVFRLSCGYIDRIYSFISSIIFIIVFANHSSPINIFNFIFPYSYSSVFGIFFLLILYVSGKKYIESRKIIHLASVGACLLACFLLKLEIMLSALAYVIFLLFILINYKDARVGTKKYHSTKKNLKYFLVVLFFAAPILAGFIYAESLVLLGKEITHLVAANLKNPIGRYALGINDLWGHFIYSVESLAFILISAAIFTTLGNKKNNIVTNVLFIFFATGSSIYLHARGYNFLYGCTSIILLVFLFFLLEKIKTQNKHMENLKDYSTFLIVISSLSLTLRMVFNNTIEFYGFYLLVPAHICLFIFLFGYIPEYFGNKYNMKYLKTGFAVYFLVAGLSALENTQAIVLEKNKRVNTDKGPVYVYDYQYSSFQAYVKDIKNHIGKNDKVLILPEGYMLSYLIGNIPVSYNNSHIPDLTADFEREQKLINEIKTKQFEYVIIVPRYTFEWGLPVIGRDYLVNAMDYIYKNFQPFLLYGDMPFKDINKFGILVLKKNNI